MLLLIGVGVVVLKGTLLQITKGKVAGISTDELERPREYYLTQEVNVPTGHRTYVNI